MKFYNINKSIKDILIDIGFMKENLNENLTIIDSKINNKVDKEHNKSLISDDDLEKLNNIEVNANNYIHPEIHGPDMIKEDSSHRFVTDDEKLLWGSKASRDIATSSTSGLMSFEDKIKLDSLNANDLISRKEFDNLMNYVNEMKLSLNNCLTVSIDGDEKSLELYNANVIPCTVEVDLSK